MADSATASDDAPSFLVRHEFLIRRLHSLSGLIPVGAFMTVHLLVNSSVLNGPETFQNAVYQIHSLGKALPVVEWVFIFLPLLFHAIVGVVIIRGGLPNTVHYTYAANVRYTLQRATGMIAALFILYHVFHMHGWVHFGPWLAAIEPIGGAKFRPYNAPTTAGIALQSWIVTAVYAVGIIASVFHLANGMWSMGITWGVWTSEAAQRRALKACGAFGVLLGLVGLGALGGMRVYGAGEPLDEARQVENRMYEYKVGAGEASPAEHKRAHEESHAAEEGGVAEEERAPDEDQAGELNPSQKDRTAE
ncbi:Succinate dehydrogenase cytochrome b558 subunit [Pseudobythopirellula maris]|uniref:Succinate dehydrogenase cytochrome b558 subunit n=1 Tax=Pseudobythopirellula maris TaxID=2527991 RepID=A0A5C5ZM29_9BACT|nr:succinate dehydrogenase cytochrome b558 subunit [Pseudobythopirellula maris]TWT88200.1 Succinate dehydrogenase cytochrome b558 subunit [Pseudobythopirellula maris]